jgi:hypothetical protein
MGKAMDQHAATTGHERGKVVCLSHVRLPPSYICPQLAWLALGSGDRASGRDSPLDPLRLLEQSRGGRDRLQMS